MNVWKCTVCGHLSSDGFGSCEGCMEKEIKRLEKLVYVPGHWQCPKCEFYLVSTNLHAERGGFSANDKPQECANGCGPMWRVTHEQSANTLVDRLDTASDEIHRLTKTAERRLRLYEGAVRQIEEWQGAWEDMRSDVLNTTSPADINVILDLIDNHWPEETTVSDRREYCYTVCLESDSKVACDRCPDPSWADKSHALTEEIEQLKDEKNQYEWGVLSEKVEELTSQRDKVIGLFFQALAWLEHHYHKNDAAYLRGLYNGDGVQCKQCFDGGLEECTGHIAGTPAADKQTVKVATIGKPSIGAMVEALADVDAPEISAEEIAATNFPPDPLATDPAVDRQERPWLYCPVCGHEWGECTCEPPVATKRKYL